MAVSLNALTLKIGSDTSGLTAGVKAVRSDIQRVNRVMRSATSASDRMKQATDSLAAIQRTGALASDEYRRGLQAIERKYGEAARGENEYADAIQRAQGIVRKAETDQQKLVKSFQDLKVAKQQGAITAREYAAGLETVKGQMRDLKAQQDGTAARMQRLRSVIGQAVPETTRLAQQTRDLRKAYSDGAITTAMFERANKRLRESYKAAKAEATGAAAAARQSAERLARVQSTVAATVPQIDRLQKEMRELNIEFRAGNVGMKDYSRTMTDMKRRAAELQTTNAATGSSFVALGGYIGAATAAYGALRFAQGGLADQFALERAALQMETFTGSAKKALRMVKEMDLFAGRSPLSFESVVGGGARLAGFGVEIDKVQDRLQRLGDVSLGNNDAMNRLTLAYGQVIAKGRLMGQEANQLREAGFRPLVLIGKRTGETVGELTKRMEQGKIAASEVAQALIDATSAGGQFHNAVNKMASGNEGSINRMTESLRRLRRDTMGMFATDIGNTAGFLSTSIEKLRSGIEYANRDVEKLVGFDLQGYLARGLQMSGFGTVPGIVIGLGQSADETAEKVDELKKSVDKLGATKIKSPVPETEIPLLETYREQWKALDRQNMIRQKGLQIVELMEARESGATSKQIEELKRLQQKTKEMQRQAKIRDDLAAAAKEEQRSRLAEFEKRRSQLTSDADALREEAERIGERFKTPFQTLTEELTKLNRLRTEGLIGQRTFDKAKVEAVSNFGSKMPTLKVELPPSISKGSREEYQLIAQSQNRSMQEAKRRHAEMIAEQRASRIAAQQSAAETKRVVDQTAAVEAAIRDLDLGESI